MRGLLPNGIAMLNTDDEHVEAMSAVAPGEVLRFGIDEFNAGRDALHACDIVTDSFDRASFTMVAGDGEQSQVALAIPGAHNVMNALAAAMVAHRLGMPLEDIARVLGEQRHISPHRMAVSTVERGGARFTLIDDSFNANPDSMHAGLDGLARWSEGAQYRVAVLGAMLELGGDEKQLHRSIGAYAAEHGIDEVVAVGSPTDQALDALAGELAQGAKNADGAMAVEWAHSAAQADDMIVRIAREHEGTVVLLKGSHASGLSTLAERWSADEK